MDVMRKRSLFSAGQSFRTHDACCYAPPAVGALSDTAIRPSVCPSPRCAAALGYRHAGCLRLSHVRTADPRV